MEKGVSSHGVFHLLLYYVICLISYLITSNTIFFNCLFICLLQVFVVVRGFFFSCSLGLVTPRYVES